MRISRRTVSTFMVVAIAVLIIPVFAEGAPLLLNHQGRLTNSVGEAVADGSYTMTFTIYDDADPAAGTSLWSSGARQVDVTDGFFSLLLGESVTLPHGLFATDAGLWLGIQVGSDVEIAPRTRLTSSPGSAVSAGVYGDIKTSAGKLVVEDDRSVAPDGSRVAISSEISNLDANGHVTVLKIANGGVDTTNLVGLFGDPDFAYISVGDDQPTDSGIVVTSGANAVDFRGHVTVLKIANGGLDTSNVVGLFGDPDFAYISVGDDQPTDSGIVVTAGANAVDFRGHVTVLKIANGGLDTSNVVGLFGDPDFAYISVGDDKPTDSGIVVTSGANAVDFRGHVTVLKIANGGLDTSNVVGLFGDPDFAYISVGDDKPTDSGIVVTSGVNALDHRGHVTVLKIANGGLDTTEVVGISGSGDTASFQMNGGGGGGGTVRLEAGASPLSGKIGVNNRNPAFEVDVVGTICATGGVCAPSDRRLKRNIQPLTEGLAMITALNPVRYDWRREEFPERNFSPGNQIGFIAQELEGMLPELVIANDNGYKSVDYGRLTPVLVDAIKELKAENDSLRIQLAELAKTVETILAVRGESGSNDLASK